MKPAYEDNWTKVYAVDALSGAALLEPNGVHAIITSPPYFGLRSYLPEGHPDKAKEIGAEARPEAWVDNLVEVFGVLRPALHDSGTLWVVVGDAYANDGKWGGYSGGKHAADLHGATGVGRGRRITGLKPKDLIGLPFMLAFALRGDGWYWRSCSIWEKPNTMPERVADRPTVSHEYVLMFSKKPRYFFDQDAVREPHVSSAEEYALEAARYRTKGKHRAVQGKGDVSKEGNASRFSGGQHPGGRNIRSVWSIATRPYPGSHYATFPADLIYPCIKAGASERGICEACGAPWERMVEKSGDLYAGKPTDERYETQAYDSPQSAPHGEKANFGSVIRKTVGWQPTCSCDADTEPATILDPFMGSGTTAWAARKLSRKSVGFDLDARNTELIRERLGPQGVLL